MMRRRIRFSWVGALALLATTVGCGQGDEPEMEIGEVQLAGKADSHDVRITRAGRGYKVVRLYGAAAKDLWAVMEKAGGFRSVERGLSYLVGTYSICASNGTQAACNIYGKTVTSGGGFDAKLHGRRFASAPSELFGALAYASGVNPRSVTEVRSKHLVCAKDSRYVWCGINAAVTSTNKTLEVSFQGLGTLGDGFVYEGWLITPDGPVSAGRFVDPKGYTVEVEPSVADVATLYVLTIEVAVGDDPAPSATHVLAGEFKDGRVDLSTTHPAALGTDFFAATGGFILETPTSAAADDYDQGIWFLDPAMGPGASLTLPTLPAGWVYEGWVVVDGKPRSTGRFTTTTGADDDGAGPAAGPQGAPPFPGQDFIDPALNVVGGKAVISVEPQPDDSPRPFALKPLVGDVHGAGAGMLQLLSNGAADSAITGTATLR